MDNMRAESSPQGLKWNILAPVMKEMRPIKLYDHRHIPSEYLCIQLENTLESECNLGRNQ